MKENMRSAISKLQRAGKNKDSVSFTYSAKDHSKKLRAKMYLDENDTVKFKLTEVSGFNSKYINSRARTLLGEILQEVLPYPTQGDNVWTKEHLNGLQPGTTITLNSSDYYFAVNTGLIECGGRQFGISRQARFVKYETATCNGGGVAMKFSIFNLQ